MYIIFTKLTNLQQYKKIKRNNNEDTTKTCPCFSFPEKQSILNIG